MKHSVQMDWVFKEWVVQESHCGLGPRVKRRARVKGRARAKKVLRALRPLGALEGS